MEWRNCQAVAEWDRHRGLEGAQNVILKGRYRKSLSERSFLIYNIFSLGKLCCLKLCAAKRSLIMSKFRRVSDVSERNGQRTAEERQLCLHTHHTVRGPLVYDRKELRGAAALRENCNISGSEAGGEEGEWNSLPPDPRDELSNKGFFFYLMTWRNGFSGNRIFVLS